MKLLCRASSLEPGDILNCLCVLSTISFICLQSFIGGNNGPDREAVPATSVYMHCLPSLSLPSLLAALLN